MRYKLTALMIQETHIQNQGLHKLKSTDGKTTLHLYNSGHQNRSKGGVGIIVNTNTKITFKPISERICLVTAKIDNSQKINIISTYAPTLENTQKKPEETQNFYNKLSSVIKMTKNRDALIIGGDFNAKTKLTNNNLHKMYKQNVGKYSKSEINENGELLLEFAKSQNL